MGKNDKSGLGRALVRHHNHMIQESKEKGQLYYKQHKKVLESITDVNDIDAVIQQADDAVRLFSADNPTAVNTLIDLESSSSTHDMTPEERRRHQKKEEALHASSLSVPRRPAWNAKMSVEELDANERRSFLVWRRSLARLEENDTLVLTPFEKNLDIWRQLWRVVERSDLLVMVVDARDPLFYRCPDLERNQNNENSDEEDGNDVVVEDQHGGRCSMCEEQIYSFHLCYECKECDYSLHKFCAELPITLQNHPLHPGHYLTLSKRFQYSDDGGFNYPHDEEWGCGICNIDRKMFYNYHCSICKFNMDIICAITMSEQKMDHPSHPHQLERHFKSMVARCNACGDEHKGDFYRCATCCWFWIHLDCALLPSKLLIQQPTNKTFTHPHPLILC